MPNVAGVFEGAATSTLEMTSTVVAAPERSVSSREPLRAGASRPASLATDRRMPDAVAKAAAGGLVEPPGFRADTRPRIGLVHEAGDRASQSLLTALSDSKPAPVPVLVNGVVAADWPSTLLALRSQPRVALVRYDVLQAARRAPPSMRLPPLEVLAPIAAEAICFVVRADSPLRTIQDVKDEPIDAGPPRGARALTAAAVYRQMFGRAMPTFSSHMDASSEAALQRLRAPGANQVVVVMAATLGNWTEASPAEARGIKVLRLDARAASERGLFAHFLPVRADGGPLAGNVAGNETALGLLSFLVSAREPVATRAEHDRDMAAFARTLCSRLADLRASSPAWRAVLPSEQLDVGHPYSASAQAVFTRCDTPSQAVLPSRAGRNPAVRG